VKAAVEVLVRRQVPGTDVAETPEPAALPELGVSADGGTIVGFAADGAGGNAQRGFRWTQASGMQKVEDWLRANGVSVPVDRTNTAAAVNADGTVVVGTLENGTAYIARVGRDGSGIGSGMISPDEVVPGLAGAGSALQQGLRAVDLVMHGLLGDPLAGRVPVGKSCFWVAGDAGRDEHSSRSGPAGVLGIGACIRPQPWIQLEAGIGAVRSRQDFANSGESEVDGQYGMAQVLVQIPESDVWITTTGMYQSATASVRRGYVNAGAQDFSSGDSSVHSFGARIRADWDGAIQFLRTRISPYVGLSYLWAKRSAYSEQGGGFPATYDDQRDDTTELRVGATSTTKLSEQTQLLLTLEGAHRFDSGGPNTSGQLVGLFAFDLPGQTLQQNWMRFGVGLQWLVGPGIATAMLNATTAGDAPSYWLNLSFRVPF
jgi:uncharacterized protein YhjY with autotransporter beta-barrel domain